MAKITLDPGEQFAHFHTFESKTVLLAGKANLRMQGKETALAVNKPIIIPPHTEHVLIAKGQRKVLLDCGACMPPNK